MPKKKTENKNIDPTHSEEEQNLMQMGDEAEELLRNQTFNKTVNGLVEATFSAFTNSKPEEPEARERTYNHYRALVDIVNTLQQRVNVRNQILESSAENDNSGE